MIDGKIVKISVKIIEQGSCFRKIPGCVDGCISSVIKSKGVNDTQKVVKIVNGKGFVNNADVA